METATDLETGELRSFVLLAEQGHFGRTAEMLGLSQPALSKRLRRLEEKVGAPLLRRGRGGARLTESGRVLLERSRGLLRDVDLALAVSRQAARGEAGVLRIGFGIASLAQLLPEAVRRFRRRFPDVQLQMQDMASAAQLAALQRDAIEVGFVRLPVREAGIESRAILRERLVAALGPGMSFRSREGLACLREAPFVVCARSVSASYYDHAVALCRQAGFTPRVVQEAGELFTQLQLVRAGMGVALVPSSAALMRVPGVRLQELRLPAAAWTIAVAWKRAVPLPPLLAAFLEVTRLLTSPPTSRSPPRRG
jgi:DNA-binding transcriptional LysR family regulator